MNRKEMELINEALGYTAEVCPPNGTPATEYITDRWGRTVRERLHAVVERIVAARVDNEHDRVTDQMLARVMEQELRAEAAERRLAEQQAAVKALADAWDERKHPGMVGIAKRVRATLSDPTALDALIARERAAALREAADFLEGKKGIPGIPRDLWEFRQWLRDRADTLTAEAER